MPHYDEMPHYVAFHLGLHCLPKYLFTSVQNENLWLKAPGRFDFEILILMLLTHVVCSCC